MRLDLQRVWTTNKTQEHRGKQKQPHQRPEPPSDLSEIRDANIERRYIYYIIFIISCLYYKIIIVLHLYYYIIFKLL